MPIVRTSPTPPSPAGSSPPIMPSRCRGGSLSRCLFALCPTARRDRGLVSLCVPRPGSAGDRRAGAEPGGDLVGLCADRRGPDRHRFALGTSGLGADRFRHDIADPTVRRVAPGPAEAVIEHSQHVARAQRRDQRGARLGSLPKLGIGPERAWQRLGVVRGDDPPRQRGVGQILAIGVGRRIGQDRRAGEGEAVNDGRRRAAFRPAAAGR